MLVCVAPENIVAVWPLVERMIDAAYAELDEITPDVQPWLVARRGLLWVYVDGIAITACATTSLIRARRGLACRVVACGGGAGDVGQNFWREQIAAVEKYARDEKCYKMQIDGRRGWARVLPDYQTKCVSYEKTL